MLYKRRKDILLPLVQPSGTAAQTITFRVKQEQRRLEGFLLQIDFTTNAVGAATGAGWAGYAGIVKEIRVKVQDPIGSRNVIQISGAACVGWTKQNLGFIDRVSQGIFGTSAFPSQAAAATTTATWYVPIRHPLVGEPFGNFLSLPLSAQYLGDDVIIEVDLNDIGVTGSAVVFSTNNPAYTANGCSIQTLVREVPESFLYIPSELRTDNFIPTATANATYEFTSNGYLTQCLIQGYSAAAFAPTVTRASLLAAGGNLRFEYGREVWSRDNESYNIALNDLSMLSYPQQVLATIAASALNTRNVSDLFIDFLSDLPGTAAFSAASVANLYTSALGGDKARLVFNDHASTSRLGQITMHRLLPLKADDLKSLAAAL